MKKTNLTKKDYERVTELLKQANELVNYNGETETTYTELREELAQIAAKYDMDCIGLMMEVYNIERCEN